MVYLLDPLSNKHIAVLSLISHAVSTCSSINEHYRVRIFNGLYDCCFVWNIFMILQFPFVINSTGEEKATRTIETFERTRKASKTRTNENGQRIKGSTDSWGLYLQSEEFFTTTFCNLFVKSSTCTIKIHIVGIDFTFVVITTNLSTFLLFW